MSPKRDTLTGAQLRRIAWWLNWPPSFIAGAVIGLIFVHSDLTLLILITAVPVYLLTRITSVAASRIKRAAIIVDAAQDLIDRLDPSGVRRSSNGLWIEVTEKPADG